MIETILGVATGLIGNIATSFTNLKTQKLKNEHDLRMREFDLKERAAEVKYQLQIESAHLESTIENAEASAYMESLKGANEDVLTAEKLKFLSKDNSKSGKIIAFLLGLIDAFRASVRPGLTAYLTILTTVLTYKAIEIINAKQPLLSALQAQELFNQVSDVVIYLTVSTVTWWFGDRRTAKFLYRLNDGNSQDKKGY